MASKELAELLRELRESKGISLRGAARDLGVDASYLSRVERGDKKASPSVLDRAASYYELPREDFAFAEGKLPSDIVEILRSHPDLVRQLRKNYGRG
jgi:transcriptional regulator with XRE-family HTH domain